MTDSSLLPFDATTADCIRRELQALIALSKMSSHDDAAVEACMRGLGAILQKQPFCVTDDTANEVLAVATEWNGQQWHEYVAALNAALGRTQQALGEHRKYTPANQGKVWEPCRCPWGADHGADHESIL